MARVVPNPNQESGISAVSHIGPGAQALGSFTVSSELLLGSCIEGGEAGTRTGAHMRCWQHRCRLNMMSQHWLSDNILDIDVAIIYFFIHNINIF